MCSFSKIQMRAQVVVLIFFLCTILVCSGGEMELNNNKKQLTPNVYLKLLQSRRREHSNLIQNMLKADYAKNYKLISLALEKIFQVIKLSNQTLTGDNYKPSEVFPTEQRIQEAVTLLLENSCLAADILLHFPEISYKVLKKIRNWRDTINWCITFVNHHITDELVVELMHLMRQEINEFERSPEFVNPYYKQIENHLKVVKPKLRKQIKKGPRLTAKTEL